VELSCNTSQASIHTQRNGSHGMALFLFIIFYVSALYLYPFIPFIYTGCYETRIAAAPIRSVLPFSPAILASSFYATKRFVFHSV
jgi:hypothetical protein